MSKALGSKWWVQCGKTPWGKWMGFEWAGLRICGRELDALCHEDAEQPGQGGQVENTMGIWDSRGWGSLVVPVVRGVCIESLSGWGKLRAIFLVSNLRCEGDHDHKHCYSFCCWRKQTLCMLFESHQAPQGRDYWLWQACLWLLIPQLNKLKNSACILKREARSTQFCNGAKLPNPSG